MTKSETPHSDVQRYPEAIAVVHERLPEESVLWAGAQNLHTNLKWIAIILAFGAFCFGFAYMWDDHAQAMLRGMEDSHWLLRESVTWMLGHIFPVYLVSAACVLFALLIGFTSWRMLYVVTSHHVVMMGKRGGMFMAFPLDNIKSARSAHVNEQGVGDVSLYFRNVVQSGRMQRKRCTLNAVNDAKAVEEMIVDRVLELPPTEELPPPDSR